MASKENLWPRVAAAALGIGGAAVLGGTLLTQPRSGEGSSVSQSNPQGTPTPLEGDPNSSFPMPRSAKAAVVDREFIAIVGRNSGLGGNGVSGTPGPEIPTPTPTRTPIPWTEGTPTLSPEAHDSQLIQIDAEQNNGIWTKVYRTQNAQIIGDLFDPTRQEFARVMANNSSALGAQGFSEIAVVFVRDRGDVPVGLGLGRVEVWDGSNWVRIGGMGYYRNGSRLRLYYAIENVNNLNSTALSGRDLAIGGRVIRFSKDGTSPFNTVSWSTDDENLWESMPVRVNR